MQCGEEYLVAGRGQVTIEGPRGAVSKAADMASCGAWRRRRMRTRRMSWPGSRGGGRSRENEATPCSKITFWVSSVSWAGQRDLKAFRIFLKRVVSRPRTSFLLRSWDYHRWNVDLWQILNEGGFVFSPLTILTWSRPRLWKRKWLPPSAFHYFRPSTFSLSIQT